MLSKGLSVKLNSIKSNLAKKLLKAGLIVEGEAHRLVAIKTGKLDSSIKTGNVEDGGSVLSISVEAGGGDAPYAKFVEFPTKKGIKNYHRRGKIVYTGNGQFFLRRALNSKKQEVIKTLNK